MIDNKDGGFVMNEEENKVNEIVEIDDEQTKGYDLENVPMEKEKKKKPKKDKGWNNLSKKQKTIILVSIFYLSFNYCYISNIII